MRDKRTRRESLVVLVAVLAVGLMLQGCAAGPRELSSMRNASSARPFATSSSQSVITFEELRSVHVATVEDAVLRLRPEFLRPRPAGVLGRMEATPDVFVDDRYYGSLRSLVLFRASDVSEVRMLSPVETAVRYGTSHAAGAIILRLR